MRSPLAPTEPSAGMAGRILRSIVAKVTRDRLVRLLDYAVHLTRALVKLPEVTEPTMRGMAKPGKLVPANSSSGSPTCGCTSSIPRS